jgi:hypothetical protein
MDNVQNCHSYINIPSSQTCRSSMNTHFGGIAYYNNFVTTVLILIIKYGVLLKKKYRKTLNTPKLLKLEHY